ncbi:MAG: hypothetical protein ABIE43_02310 [Patescibacteria group bacterium]
MQEKELIKKIEYLKKIKPDNQWKNESREILCNQIFNSVISLDNSLMQVLTFPQKIIRAISQPALAAFLIALVIIGGSIISLKAARFTKPGDSLFIARIISEKAQLVITFNEDEKTKLGIKFANDHAKDITRVLADSTNKNEERVEQLHGDFKKEIDNVKIKLGKMNIDIIDKGLEEKDLESNLIDEEGVQSNNETQVFSANLKKEDRGMQISDNNHDNKINKEGVAENDLAENTATSTINKEENSDNLENIENAQKILEEAEVLFNDKDYDGTLSKLEEVGAIIEGTNNKSEEIKEEGRVKGISTDKDNEDNKIKTREENEEKEVSTSTISIE